MGVIEQNAQYQKRIFQMSKSEVEVETVRVVNEIRQKEDLEPVTSIDEVNALLNSELPALHRRPDIDHMNFWQKLKYAFGI